MMDWTHIYQETLVAEHYAYFDTGAAAPPPAPVIDAVKEYLEKTAQLGTYLPGFRKEVYQNIELTREKMAQFIHASAKEISFTKNGTESVCLVARGIDWQEGDEIILPDTEMLSNVSVWHLLAKEKKIRLVPLKATPEGMIDPESLRKLITSKTRLVSFVALSNVTGAVQPVAQLCRLAQASGVLSHVSASQALGMLAINVQEWHCDFLSACGRKGLRAIEGSGVLYVREEHIASLSPALVGWWNSSFDAQSGEVLLPETAKRFEAGCPNVPAIVSLDRALDYANDIGIGVIEQRCRELTQYALNRLSGLPGFEVYGPVDVQLRMGIIPFNIKGIQPDKLTAWLEQQKIVIESGDFMASAILRNYQIEKMGRISLHYFNQTAEIDRLVAAITEFTGVQQ
ncbi:TPA: aminotransferase class V-fold PLP-dependent enzyme [Salmonella enterica]|uniref:Aminotransferase class V-fold PLP-dependent enzyme n=1 Tax=Salmonella enterica TaxID=28901 RepID=A0A756I4R1_SALER|nr:aminotransferase class V-fold PLP-dependent enzyme [Salmonella enterica]HAD5968739.1 aminotransferase class V-fold PLP-dependent enzyme [Salmonella enterica subsp. enterica serovar Typhimurium]HAG0017924.1 aminotransferase class V-fold PLP-dependent enzyme [Salmonella enterica]